MADWPINHVAEVIADLIFFLLLKNKGGNEHARITKVLSL
jgi:hypothetical protein